MLELIAFCLSVALLVGFFMAVARLGAIRDHLADMNPRVQAGGQRTTKAERDNKRKAESRSAEQAARAEAKQSRQAAKAAKQLRRNT